MVTLTRDAIEALGQLAWYLKAFSVEVSVEDDSVVAQPLNDTGDSLGTYTLDARSRRFVEDGS